MASSHSECELLANLSNILELHDSQSLTWLYRVVGGMDTIDKMEAVPTDKKDDRPVEEIIIESCQVFSDPYEEAAQQVIFLFAKALN